MAQVMKMQIDKFYRYTRSFEIAVQLAGLVIARDDLLPLPRQMPKIRIASRFSPTDRLLPLQAFVRLITPSFRLIYDHCSVSNSPARIPVASAN